MTAINLNLEPLVEELNHEQFFKLCMANKDIAMERSSAGKLKVSGDGFRRRCFPWICFDN